MTNSLMTSEQRVAALEQLERLQRKNRQRTLWATWGSIIIAVAVLSMLIPSMLFLHNESERLKQSNDDLRKQIEKNDRQLEAKRAELRTVDDELTQKQDLLAAVQQKLGTNNVDDAKRLIVASEASRKITPRIFIHIRSKGQLPIAAEIAEKFRIKGYAVPKAEILVDKGPAHTEIRYFHQTANEHSDATALAREVGDDARVRFVPGYEDSPLVKPQQFEVWLAP
jgi:hypothetical protein